MSEEARERRPTKQIPTQKIANYTYQIPQTYKPNMHVPGIIYADDQLLEKMKTDATLEQCANVACLPGIYKASITLPDGHEGYGFPIGGVAAFDYEQGVISPGGVGYDINCGVRLLRTNLTENDVRPKLPQILEGLFHNIPSGLGSKGKIRLTPTELDKALANGVDWAIKNGYGWQEDAEHCEENGHMPQADPTKVSTNAKSRGMPQTGSLGSGNHFLEIDVVDKIFDPQIAKQIGIHNPGQIMIFIHTGSRGLGHQVCSDYLRVMEHATYKYKIQIPDRELACAPGTTPEATDYYAAMAAACNYAWANRQMITHWTRQTLQDIYQTDPENLDLHLIYDVAHNIAKIETHNINGKPTKVYVHRKGSTRAFSAGHPDIPKDHRNIGQIVLIPGTMGTSSWVMVGTPRAMEVSFGSTAHGAGRFMSRTAATKKFWGADVKKRLEQRGILIRAQSMVVIAEESPESYKNVDAVVEVSHQVGIAMIVARLVPIGVTKG